ncbi:hypothetical protein FQN50_005850 [Emmonsiellopsis sp. PD_5]|nr:hypothetical protein FQN50_005850 [Emmonsiellopsis sp. PD_5]
MSLARPARCLICSFSRAPLALLPRRQFHQSLFRQSDSDSKAKELKKIKDLKELTPSHFAPYTKEEKARLAEEYTPEQIAAIEAGEESVKAEDLAKQFAQKDDPWSLQYLDDFSTIEPTVDRHVRNPVKNVPIPRMKSEDELMGEVSEFFDTMTEEDIENNPEKIADFMDKMDLVKDPIDEASSLVPDITHPYETLEKMGEGPDLELRRKEMELEQNAEGKGRMDSGDASETELDYAKLKLATGLDEVDIKRLNVRVLVVRQVANQTRLGKVRKSAILSVAGNGNGLLGIGEAKARDFKAALVQAHARAIRNMKPIQRYENRTIFGDVRGKVGAVEVELMHRPPGFGLRCQKLIWELCRAGGIRDIAARVPRSRSKMNTVKAAYEAMLSQKNPEDIARARGRKLVDVRKVYYAGLH